MSRRRGQPGLPVTSSADEFVDALRSGQFGAALDSALRTARRHPLPVVLMTAGAGWLLHRLSRRMTQGYAWRRFAGNAGDIPVLNTGQARIYDPDASPRHPTQDSLESRREMSARV